MIIVNPNTNVFMPYIYYREPRKAGKYSIIPDLILNATESIKQELKGDFLQTINQIAMIAPRCMN